MYQKKFILKFEKFIRKCNNVFRIRFVIYEKHKTKINFVVFFCLIRFQNSIEFKFVIERI